MSKYNYKKVAADYDDLSQQHQWKGPELLFKNLSDFVKKETKLLDIGIGTGISSERFHSKQVELYGLDDSPDLLAICKEKGLFKELILLDILQDEIPYPDSTFDYVICLGVLHFFSDLDEVFAKISRAVKRSGLFAFTFKENKKNDLPYFRELINDVEICHHNKTYIQTMADQFSFSNIHEEVFTSIKDLKTKETSEHNLIVWRKE